MKPKELISKVGGSLVLARALGLKGHASLFRWKEIPPRHCLVIEREFGISREELRPDLFRREEAQP